MSKGGLPKMISQTAKSLYRILSEPKFHEDPIAWG